jgi:hypothetical protein
MGKVLRTGRVGITFAQAGRQAGRQAVFRIRSSSDPRTPQKPQRIQVDAWGFCSWPPDAPLNLTVAATQRKEETK